MKENIKIFYSWQSDLSDDTNKRAIRDMLKKAKSKIEHENKDNINMGISKNHHQDSLNLLNLFFLTF